MKYAFSSYSKQEYARQLNELIENALPGITDEQHDEVLLEAFKLLERRPGIKYSVSYSTIDERNAE